MDFDWEFFLRRWSQEIIESIAPNLRTNSTSDWLGYPGATESQIARAEAQLETASPPSYRSFLKVSNGWQHTTSFIGKLWSAEEINWFSVRHQDWINEWLKNSKHFAAESHNGSLPPPSIPSEEYFTDGNEQDCSKIRVEYLQTTLEISQRGEGAIYLLNPQVVAVNGEWEAWFLGDWLPGADRYCSFQEMMQAEYESFLELRETPINLAKPVLSDKAEDFPHKNHPS